MIKYIILIFILFILSIPIHENVHVYQAKHWYHANNITVCYTPFQEHGKYIPMIAYCSFDYNSKYDEKWKDFLCEPLAYGIQVGFIWLIFMIFAKKRIIY